MATESIAIPCDPTVYTLLAAGLANIRLKSRGAPEGRLIIASSLPDPTATNYMDLVEDDFPFALRDLAASDNVYFKPKRAMTMEVVRGFGLIYPDVVPVHLPDSLTETVVIPINTAAGTIIGTFDTDGWESVFVQADSGPASFDVRFKFNENGNGVPPSERVINLGVPASYPIQSTQSVTAVGKYGIPVTGKKMQLYLQTLNTSAITLLITRSHRRVPAPRGGRSSFLITSALTNLFLLASSTSKTLQGYDLLNTSAAAKYLHLYANNATTGLSASNFRTMIPFAANGKAALGDVDMGWYFGAGIVGKITSDPEGSTLATAGDIVGVISCL